MASAAPQRGQLVWPRAITPPHQEHFPPEGWKAGSGACAAYAVGAARGGTVTGGGAVTGCGAVAGGIAPTGGLAGARFTGEPQPTQKF